MKLQENTAPLEVRVNDELVLDAGSYCCAIYNGTPGLYITPPRVPLIDQILAYLERKKDPTPVRLVQEDIDALAAAAVCVRWGTYLAVLADAAKPVWALAPIPTISCVAAEEMMRIQIEAGYAFARWIELYRRDPKHAARLAERAVAHLPVPATFSNAYAFLSIVNPDIARKALNEAPFKERHIAQSHSLKAPIRSFANALTVWTVSAGPLERLRHGAVAGYPLDKRRLIPKDEKEVLAAVSGRLRAASKFWTQYLHEWDAMTWLRTTTAFHLREGLAACGWSLALASRTVFLPDRKAASEQCANTFTQILTE